MKILHIITSLDTGGAEKMLFKLLSSMNKQRFESRVICLIPIGPVGKQIMSLGVKIETLELKRGTISPKGLIKLVKTVKEWKPDIIQTWLYHADLLGYFVAKLTGIKNLIWNLRCSNMDLSKYSKITTWTVKACAFFSNFPVSILSNSDIAIDYHIKTFGYKNNNFQVILNGFDTFAYKPDRQAGQKIRQELDIAKDVICIGLVGRYDPIKDHESFIKAAQIVNRKFPDIMYILAGRDVSQDNFRLMTIIKDVKLQNHVKLLGEREDVSDIMNALDFYCSASAFGEGFPNVVGEAMACGVPCVVTDVGHSAAVVDKTGFVVPPKQYETLAQGMMKFILMSGKEREELGQKARQRIKNKYSLDEIVQEYEDLYSNVAKIKL